ncbi:MAG: UbiA family prenyltransferase [Methanocellales archaeon]
MEVVNRFKPYVQILRPEISDMDLALPAASGLLAAYFAYPDAIHSLGKLPDPFAFIIAVIGAYCAITSTYVFNDYCDVDIDSINLPNRPLPSAKMTKNQALYYSFLLLAIAASAAAYLNIESLVVLAIGVVVISIYSKWAKRHTFMSFFFVGVAYGTVPIGVWLAFDPTWKGAFLPLPAIFLGLMICVTDWGFTLAGVSRDVAGDRRRGAPTMPVTFGVPFTSKFIMLCWIMGVIFSIIIFISARLGVVYLLGALASGIWMLTQCYDFVRNPTPERGGKLFLQGSRYRGVMFASLIIDVLLCVSLPEYYSLRQIFPEL